MWGSRMFRKTKRKTNSTPTNTGTRRRRRKQHQQNVVDDSDSSSIEVERRNGPLSGSFVGTPSHTNGTIERTTSMGWNDDIARQPSRIGLGNRQKWITITDENNSVHIVEKVLRQIVLCSTMFIAGTIFSYHSKVAYHILELSVCAWGTCLLITLLNWAQNRKEAENYLQQEDEIMTIEPTRLERLGSRSGSRSAGTIQRGGNKKRSRQVELLVDQPPTKPQPAFAETIVPPVLEPSSTDILPNKQSQEIVQQAKQQHRQHPHLKNLYVMMTGNERIFPNGIETEIDNDLFYGKMLLMFRTPEADDPSTSSTNSSYFNGKQRRFEFQWQIRLKKLPEGEVFLAAEIEEQIQMGMIQRAVVGAALKFTKKMNQGFSYYFSDTPDSNSYLSFPVGTSMDRFCVTKTGDPLPILGQAIKEDDEFLKQRKKGLKIMWSTDHVYTLGLWSAYVDWVDWQIQGFPGIRPFSITSCVGVQPIMLNIFTQSSSEATKEVLTSIELSNATKANLGARAKTWIAKTQNTEVKDERQMQHLSSDVTDGIESSEEIGSIDDEDESLDIESNEEVSLDESSDDDDNDDADDDKYESGDLVDEENALGIDTATSSYLLTSGSALHLREGPSPSLGNFVASGGGYACLQSTPTTSIIIEKNQPKKKKKKGLAHSTLIRSGDLVRVKLVDVTTKSVKWLTIHRGWWLKWSINRPERNGLFYICSENHQQGSLIALGCPFSLVSKRWSNYTVGACVESSTKYGGRMLGIYKTDMSGEDDDNPIQHALDYPAEKVKDNRILSLLLCAEAYNSDVLCSSPLQSPIRNPSESKALVGGDLAIPALTAPGNEQQKMYHVDVPVWLEMMNRTTRSKQIVYAVRIKETVSVARSGIDGQETGASSSNASTRSFVKLRTIQELAPLLRLGVECKPEMSPTSDWLQHFDFQAESESDNDADSFSSSSSDESSDSEEEMDDDEEDESHFLIAGPSHDQVVMTFDKEEAQSVVEEEGGAERYSNIDNSETLIVRGTSGRVSTSVRRSSSKLRREESADSENPEALAMSTSFKGELAEQQVCPQFEVKKKSKHAAVIGRVASTVKNSTVITGKHVKNIGALSVKGTVSATRAAGRVIPVSSAALYKQPRKHEPGGRGRVHRKSSDRRHIKMIGRALKKSGNSLSSVHSGQLLASDKVCRQISTILSDVSDNGISLLVSTNTQLESAFLRGNSAEIGVKALTNVDQKVDTEYIIARCIYDGKWREEYCILYTNDQHIAFYPPLGKKPCLAISFDEILSVRICEKEDTTSTCPLPGLFVLAIDTAYKCHYLIFLEVQQRENFLNDALFHMGNDSHSRKKTKEFESFRMSLETSLTGSVGKWRAVTTGSKGKDKKKQRRVLNGRKMSFDTVPIYNKETDGGAARENAQEKIALYVQNLLRMALSFSPDKRAADSQFIEFLDECSRLRTMSLHDIDYTSKEAFCIFVNLYHCLLQHSLLLAVDGLPTKRSVAHFKRCSCYEIGDSVFSLSELECCVIRGKTSRPSHIKSPFVDSPKKSRSYRQVYGLGATDFRINFILNNGDKSYPSKVPILTPQTMDDKMDVAAFLFLMDTVKIDSDKRTVFLPKVCDLYRDDFGDGLVCLSRCLIYLDTKSQLAIGGLLEGGVVSVKFSHASNGFHSSLMLMDQLSVSGV